MLGKSLIKAAAGNAGGVETDEYFNQTTLLLHGDGSQGANNVSNPGPPAYVAFEDGSSNDFPITVNGDAYGSPFSPYNTSWSVYFAGADDWVDIDNSSGALLGSGAWTMECWFYATTTGVQRQLLDFRYPSGGQSLAVFLQTSNEIAYWNGTVRITGGTVSPNQWNHVLCSRDGSNDVRLFLNGVQIGSAYNDTTNYTTAVCRIGCANTGADFQGYISNVRLVNGNAVETSGFTVPTSPLTEVSGTTFLGLQANRFVDNSTTPVTSVTPNSDVSIKSFSPFAETDTTTGSGYFDGTGDYLTIPDNGDLDLGTGDFSCELWCYLTTDGSDQHFLSGTATGDYNFGFVTSDKTIRFGRVNTAWDATSSAVTISNGWHHISATRVSGTLRIFFDGVEIFSGANTQNYIVTTSLIIGSDRGTGRYVNGYLSNVKVVKGAGVTSVTVPTSPATSDANTELLTCQYRGTVRNVGFIDSSPNKFLITRNGNTTQGSFSPFSAENGKWSGFFDDVNDYLSLAKSSDFAFAGDFTIEFWYWNDGGNGIPFSTADNGNYTTGGFAIEIVSGNFRSWIGGAQTLFAPTYNGWHHFALSRESGTCRAFHDGVLQITFSNSTTITQTGTNTPLIGARRTGASGTGSPGDFWDGWLSNLSILNGTAKYTSAFTPSTTPLNPSETNQVLLACTANRFIDANTATTAKTITPNGGAAVQPFSPFAPTAAYSASVNGGSGYFDGSGDYLTTPDNSAFDLLGNNFCIEAWIYVPNHASTKVIYGHYGGGAATNEAIFYVVGSTQKLTFRFYDTNSSSTIITASTTFDFNSWNHVSVVRNGTTISLYQNGTLVGSDTFVGNIQTSNGLITLGSQDNGGNAWLGWMSDLRVTIGSPVYTSSYSVPTAPLNSITNTILLMNYQNAGIFDNTGKNNLETVGNAQVDTSVVKYGTGSMKFDGTGDNLLIPDTANFDFGTGDFTIEFWLYRNNTTGDMALIDGRSGVSTGWLIYLNGTSKIVWFVNSAVITGSTTIGSGSFYHIAIARSGTSVKLFVDGTEDGSATNSTSTDSGAVSIGSKSPGASGSSIVNLNGYIDDLRISRVARYTTGFTPPTAAFPDL